MDREAGKVVHNHMCTVNIVIILIILRCNFMTGWSCMSRAVLQISTQYIKYGRLKELPNLIMMFLLKYFLALIIIPKHSIFYKICD